jgi:hypothetical protein
MGLAQSNLSATISFHHDLKNKKLPQSKLHGDILKLSIYATMILCKTLLPCIILLDQVKLESLS